MLQSTRKGLISTGLIIITIALSCTKWGDDRNVERKDVILTKAQVGYVTSGNDFGLTLFKHQENLDYKSCQLSPLSAQISVGMLLPGAEGETAREMVTSLGFGQDAEETVHYLSSLSKQLQQMDRKTDLAIANALLINTSSHVSVLPSYKEALSDFHDALIEEKDFHEERTALISEVNQWSSRNTGGRIPVLMEADKNLNDDVAILLNALYFKSEWEKPFKKKLTTDGYFYSTDGIPSRVSMMRQQDTFRYYEDTQMQVLQMAYGNGAFAFTVFLPWKDKVLLSEVIAGLDDAKLRTLDGAFREREVSVTLPSFKEECDVDLVPLLDAAGIRRAFRQNVTGDPGQPVTGAEFGKMVTPAVVNVSTVQQKVFIQVDETGAEAAAVTETHIDAPTAAPEEGPSSTKLFTADHPFLYMISEISSGTILFLGTLTGE